MNVACSRMKAGITPWHAKKAHGELEYRTDPQNPQKECHGRFGKSRAAVVKPKQGQRWRGKDQDGEDRRSRHGPGKERAAMIGRGKRNQRRMLRERQDSAYLPPRM